MIACGEAEGGSASPAGVFSQFVQNLLPALPGVWHRGRRCDHWRRYFSPRYPVGDIHYGQPG